MSDEAADTMEAIIRREQDRGIRMALDCVAWWLRGANEDVLARYIERIGVLHVWELEKLKAMMQQALAPGGE